jgi:hypothetical protein
MLRKYLTRESINLPPLSLPIVHAGQAVVSRQC